MTGHRTQKSYGRCLSGTQLLVKQFVSELIGWIESVLQRHKLRRARIRAAKLLRRGLKLIPQGVEAIDDRQPYFLAAVMSFVIRVRFSVSARLIISPSLFTIDRIKFTFLGAEYLLLISTRL